MNSNLTVRLHRRSDMNQILDHICHSCLDVITRIVYVERKSDLSNLETKNTLDLGQLEHITNYFHKIIMIFEKETSRSDCITIMVIRIFKHLLLFLLCCAVRSTNVLSLLRGNF